MMGYARLLVQRGRGESKVHGVTCASAGLTNVSRSAILIPQFSSASKRYCCPFCFSRSMNTSRIRNLLGYVILYYGILSLVCYLMLLAWFSGALSTILAII